MSKRTTIIEKNRILITLIFVVVISMVIFWKIRLSNVPVSREQIIEGETFLNNSDYDNSFITKIGSIQKIAFCNDDTNIDYTDRTVDLTVKISETDRTTIWSQTYHKIKIQTNKFGDSIAVSQPPELKRGQRYVLQIIVDGKKTNTISSALYGDRGSLLLLYLLCCALILIIIMTAILLFDTKNEKKLKIGFAVTMILMGILSNMVMIPLCVPDEDYHFMKAYHISNQILGIQEDGYNMAITESGISRMLEFDNIQNTYYYWSDWSYGNQLVEYPSIRYMKCVTHSSMTDVVYLPSAMTMAVCRYLHAPYQIILLLGRMANVLLLVIIALLAMRVYSELESMILAICLFPATIWLASSFSYDTWNLAFSMLFVAYCCYCSKKIDQMRFKNVLILAILLAVFVPVKIVYIIMALMGLMIPRKKWEDKRLIYGAGLATLCSIILAFWVKGSEIIAMLTSSAMDTRGIGDAQANSYTIGWVIRHPINTILVLAHTLILYTDKFLAKGLSGEFFVKNVPSFLIAALAGLMFLVIISCIDKKKVLKRDRTIALINYLVGIVSILITFLFAYNNISENQIGIIEGVQGRYFIPFMIILPWVIQSEQVRIKMNEIENRSGKKILIIGIVLAGVWVFFCKFSGIAQKI